SRHPPILTLFPYTTLFRSLYVALTRAENDLMLIVPLKFHLTQQPRTGDAHVYGGRSRFLTEKVVKTLEAVSFHGSAPGAADTLRSEEHTSELQSLRHLVCR